MQHISILTAGSDIHEPLIDHIKSKVSVGESFCITRDNSSDMLDKLSICSPFFSDFLLVEIICDGMDLDNFKKLLKKLITLKECKFIFRHSKRELFDVTVEFLDNVYTIDNYKPQQGLLTLYLKSYTNKYITAEAEDELYKRMKGQWALLNTVLLEIDELPNKTVSKKDIEGLISSNVNLNIHKLVISLITGTGYREHVKTLFNYKYADKYVYKRMCERINMIIDLKKDYIKGELRFNNLHEYAKDKKISSFVLETLMDSVITKYSLEYLYNFKFVIKKHNRAQDSVLQIILEVVN